MTRVLLVAGSLRSGGTERQIAYLANGLFGTGVQVEIALLAEDHPLAYTLAPGIAVHFRAARDLRLLSRSHDCVYSFLDAANVLSAVEVLGRSTRLVWGVRDSRVPTGWIPRLATAGMRLLAARANALIVNARAVADAYAHLHIDPCVVVANAIDAEAFHPDHIPAALDVPPETVVIGFVARRTPKKRHDLFADAIRRLRRDGIDVTGVLVGRGTDDPAFAQVDLVQLGERADIARLTARFDICVCLSDAEGMPNSLLEGMACGKACVGSDVGGVAELLGEAGVVVANEPDSIDRALRQLCTDAEKRRALGSAARQRVLEHFSIPQMVERTLAVIDAPR